MNLILLRTFSERALYKKGDKKHKCKKRWKTYNRFKTKEIWFRERRFQIQLKFLSNHG